MDQKNTIVKCKAHPNCLFNHNGVCDNYVINIGENGSCQEYIETEDMVDSINVLGNINVALPEDIKRGLRANGNFIKDDSFNLCSAACYHYDFKGACMYCQLRQEYLGPERLMKPCDLFTKGGSGAIKMKVAEFDKFNKNKSVLKSDHLCDINCVSAHYAEDGELYCALIQDYPERPLRCSAYDDGSDE